jgi:HAD superfamily hydrolase (TIGR01509 family)
MTACRERNHIINPRMPLDTPAISALRCSAIAFDLDGILIDTEPIFAEAVRRFLTRRAIPFDADFMHSMMGAPAAQSLPRFREQYRLPEPVEAIAAEAKTLFFDVLGDHPGPLMPGVREFLSALEQRRVPFCIATSSGPEFVRRVFGPHGLLDRFQFVLTCNDVKHGKPFPDVYHLAAKRFAVAPSEMLVFEDSPNGLRAAKAAKAQCIVVPHAATPRHLLEGADAIVTSLEADDLRRLLGW